METIRKNWENLQERLVRAAERAGRNPREITVVAVTKTRAPAEIEAAIRSGIHIVAENRIQEAEAKKEFDRAEKEMLRAADRAEAETKRQEAKEAAEAQRDAERREKERARAA